VDARLDQRRWREVRLLATFMNAGAMNRPWSVPDDPRDAASTMSAYFCAGSDPLLPLSV
jgi:hypothetical protein